MILGLPQREVISPSFFTATVLAGLLVGAANYALVQAVVGTRLKRLTTHMVRVQRQLVTATRSADWSGCNPLECALPVDSEDEIGRSAVAFNALIGTLAHSHAIESATRGFTRVVASHLELDALARDSLATILKDTGATAGILLVEEEQGLKPLATVGIRDPEQVAANAQVTAALRSGQTLRLDVAAEQVVVDSVLLDQTAREVIVVPLSFKDVPLGALVLASTTLSRRGPSCSSVTSRPTSDLPSATPSRTIAWNDWPRSTRSPTRTTGASVSSGCKRSSVVPCESRARWAC